MAKLFNLEITERKLLFLSFIIIAVLSIGLAQSFNSGSNPDIFGHSAEELGNACSWILDPLSGIPSTDQRWIDCDNARQTAGALWDGDYTSVRSAYSYASAGGSGGSSTATVCAEVVGKNQAGCDTLGTGWVLQGSSKETMDAIWCGMTETLANDWWGHFGGSSNNQNLLGASWGIGNSFSSDADKINISNSNPGYSTSTIASINVSSSGLGLNPPMWVTGFNRRGTCTEGVLSWRSVCCKTF